MGFWAALGGAASVGLPVLGGVLQAQAADKLQKKDYERQKEFAQNSIAWKVQDAINAGIHPLAALGAAGFSYRPSMIGDNDFGMSRAGQAIGDIIRRNASYDKEVEILSKKLLEGQVKEQNLKNMQMELNNKQQGMLLNSGGVISGQGYSFKVPEIYVKDSEGRTPGLGPGLTQSDMGRFGMVEHYSEPVSEGLESDTYSNAKMFVLRGIDHAKHLFYYQGPDYMRGGSDLRNSLRERLRSIQPPAGKGYEYRYNPYNGNVYREKMWNGTESLLYTTGPSGVNRGDVGYKGKRNIKSMDLRKPPRRSDFFNPPKWHRRGRR